jgi:hypothetical protein
VYRWILRLTGSRRFHNKALRFMDAYAKGLTGKEAAWAARRYHGHRNLPPGAAEEIRREISSHEEQTRG